MADIIEISDGTVRARITTLGAELCSFRRGETEYLWQADPAYWGRHAPVLFPIVGSLRNDRAFSAQGSCMMGRHGFARTREFEITAVGTNLVSLTLTSHEATRAAFPYPFMLTMTYSLEPSDQGRPVNTLRQSFEVANPGDTPLPCSFGGHPAFNVPVPGRSDTWEDYELLFTEPWTYSSPRIVAGGLWDYSTRDTIVHNEDRLPLRRSLFAFDTLVFEHVPDDTLILAGKGNDPLIRFKFEGFPYLGIWTPGGERGTGPLLAIEPWTGTATRTDEDDAFEHKQGTLFVAPGDTLERSFTMTLL